MSKIKIEIIAITSEKIYSVGKIEISPSGDVYIISKVLNSGQHTSRHHDGTTHQKAPKLGIKQKIMEAVPIEDFKGIEFLGTHAFGLHSLPELFNVAKLKECDGLFAFDMRKYKDAAFNMGIAILTDEGLPQLFDSWKSYNKRQIYIYTDSHPMIAITIADAKNTNTE